MDEEMRKLNGSISAKYALECLNAFGKALQSTSIFWTEALENMSDSMRKASSAFDFILPALKTLELEEEEKS